MKTLNKNIATIKAAIIAAFSYKTTADICNRFTKELQQVRDHQTKCLSRAGAKSNKTAQKAVKKIGKIEDGIIKERDALLKKAEKLNADMDAIEAKAQVKVDALNNEVTGIICERDSTDVAIANVKKMFGQG